MNCIKCEKNPEDAGVYCHNCYIVLQQRLEKANARIKELDSSLKNKVRICNEYLSRTYLLGCLFECRSIAEQTIKKQEG